MPKSLQKSLQTYLSKLKNPSITSPSWILSGCKHPRTPSFADEAIQPDNHGNNAATLSDVDRFLFENFNSLYRSNGDEDANHGHHIETTPSGLLFGSSRLSSSTWDDAAGSGSSTSTTANESVTVSAEVKCTSLPRESIAVLTYSPNPYDDFRRSMEEMVEIRLRQHQTVDWDFMEELLLCYLKLNEKKSHSYIMGAFVDIIVVLRQNPVYTPGKSRKIPITGERKSKFDAT